MSIYLDTKEPVTILFIYGAQSFSLVALVTCRF